MVLKIKKGIIYACEEGMEDRAVGSVFDTASDEDEQLIECGSEILPAVKNFITKVNNGEFKPRAAVKEFEQILLKYAS